MNQGQNREDLKRELIRKGLHISVALAPTLASFHYTGTLAFLALGTAGYALLEMLRHRGTEVPLVSLLTRLSARYKDGDRFVLGPLTLGLGALLTLLCFPPMPAAVGIYALAFGDSLSSLVGKFLGRLRPRFLGGKSLEGAAVCFAASFTAAFLLSHRPLPSAAAALAATVADSLPLGNWDNIVIPLLAALQWVLMGAA
jgi:dolichol kinase